MKNARAWQGILLAAGKGARFDASGARNKLLQALPSGSTVAVSSAQTLLSVLPSTLAVISPSNDALVSLLYLVGCATTICQNAHEGMASSLVHALKHAPDDCPGWIIALADMPYVQASTIAALVQALQEGAGIVAPTYLGRRGNPVGFSRDYLPQLLALKGDKGARDLLKALDVKELAVDDAGILQDIDVPQDLH
jgi:molybdenum cofactor cytidylyltransferase